MTTLRVRHKVKGDIRVIDAAKFDPGLHEAITEEPVEAPVEEEAPEEPVTEEPVEGDEG